MTRIPWAEWRPGPLDRRGYSGTVWLPLSYKEGEVKHSTEGPLAAAFGVFTDPTRQASWHFTLPKQGPVRAYQHYELEDICWHCGQPGDERRDTSLIGNMTLIGLEHEGRAGEPLTGWQVESTTMLSRDLRAVLPNYGNAPPTLRRNMWEHGWLSNTACPSGRIPWAGIIAALQEEVEDVPTQQVWDDFVKAQGDFNDGLSDKVDDLIRYKQANEPLTAELSGKIDTLTRAIQDLAPSFANPGAEQVIEEIIERLEE